MSHDHVKLKYLFDLIKPAVVMVQDGPTFAKALTALDLTGVTVVQVVRPCDGIKSVSFAELAATPVTADVEASIAKSRPTLSASCCSPPVRPACQKPSSIRKR